MSISVHLIRLSLKLALYVNGLKVQLRVVKTLGLFSDFFNIISLCKGTVLWFFVKPTCENCFPTRCQEERISTNLLSYKKPAGRAGSRVKAQC